MSAPAQVPQDPRPTPPAGAFGVADRVAAWVEGGAPRGWGWALAASLTLLAGGVFAAARLVSTGTGVWGVNHPVMWGWDIVNFVWWIGLGHAGTLISAILLLFRQRWRAGVHRVAEAMTLFAVICAAVYPVLHVGRPWLVWWLLPLPSSHGVWPQFHSPLMWDLFAVATYFTVSAFFWYLGLLPDLALLRDRARTRWRRGCYGALALGWRGSARHWQHYEKATLVVAGLSTVLVVSVHSVVSLDFAATQLPGWHGTLFPPFFVAGAIYSGLAMVLMLVIPLRRLCRLETIITAGHIDRLCKIMLGTGLLVAYAYLMEWAAAGWASHPGERSSQLNRLLGPMRWAYWTALVCGVAVPQLLWRARTRSRLVAVFAISACVNVAMWCERLVIVAGSLQRDWLPSSWGSYAPTAMDVLFFLGTFGLFATLFLLFVRFLPLAAITEALALNPAAPPALGAAAGAVEAPPQPAGAHGLMAQYTSAAGLLEAARRARALGIARFDAVTPYPVEGLDSAMGLAESKAGWFGAAGGAAGAVLGLGMVWWMNGKDYPLLTGGKPFFSALTAGLPALELGILLAVLGTLAGMFWLCRLPRHTHPLLRRRRGAEDLEGFFLLIESGDPKFDGAAAALAGPGCARMEWVAGAGENPRRKKPVALMALGMAMLAGAGLLGFRGTAFRRPPLEIFSDMKRQARLNPQAGSDFFADGRASRLPVEGTVPRGAVVSESARHPFHTGRVSEGGRFVQTNALPLTPAVLARGRDRYEIHCAPCHGATGAGNGIAQRLGVGVVGSLLSKRIAALPDGDLFDTLTFGRNLMQNQTWELNPADRWAVTAYVRALQQAPPAPPARPEKPRP